MSAAKGCKLSDEMRQDQMAGGAEVAEELRELRRQVSELANGSAARIEQLQRDLTTMTAAAVAREREYATRENELNAKLLAAVTQGHAAKFDAGQLTEKLAAAENLNRALTAQAVQIEGTLRAQTAQVGGLETGKREMAAQYEHKVAGLERGQRALEAKLVVAASERDALVAECDVMRARVAELVGARSRRLLLKFGLVHRCSWESSG